MGLPQDHSYRNHVYKAVSTKEYSHVLTVFSTLGSCLAKETKEKNVYLFLFMSLTVELPIPKSANFFTDSPAWNLFKISHIFNSKSVLYFF